MKYCTRCGSNLLEYDMDNDIKCLLCGHYMSYFGKAEPHKIEPKTTIQNRKRRDRDSLVHGTNSGYTIHKCRCVECTEAHRIYQRTWLAERAVKV